MSTLTVALVAGYVIFCVALAFFLDFRAKRKKENQTSVSYATGRGTMGLLMVFCLVIGNSVSGSYVVGNLTGVMEHDIAYLWTFYAYIIGWGLVIAFMPIYRAAYYKYGASSVGDIFRVFYGPRVSACVTLMILVAFAGAVSAQTVIVSGLLQALLGLSRTVSVIVTVAALTLIALMGGMKGLARVNTIHVFVLFASVIVVCIGVFISLHGDYGQVVAKLGPEGTFKLFGGSRSLVFIIGAVLVQPFGGIPNALIMAGTLGAKDLKTARKSQSIIIPVSVAFFVVIILIATGAKFLWPEMSPEGAWYSIAGKFGPVVAALASCGVLAASMSTAPTQIMLMASSIVDLCKPKVKKEVPDRVWLTTTKVLVVVCGVGFQLLGLISSDIVGILTNAYTIWAVCGIVFTIALLWKRPNEKAMYYSMLLGSLACIVWIVYDYTIGGSLFGIPIAYAAGVTSVVSVFLITLVTSKKGPSEGYLRIREAKQELKAAIANGVENGPVNAEIEQ